MRLLVELGADPCSANVDNCTPLMAAAGVGTCAPAKKPGPSRKCSRRCNLPWSSAAT